MVDTARSKAHLADLESTALTPEDVAFGDPDVGEFDVHVTVRGIVMTKDMHRPDNLDTGGVDRHKDLGLLAERFCIG